MPPPGTQGTRRLLASGCGANSQGLVAAWGNSWVVAGIVLELPFLQRAVCLPVLFRLWRPKRKQYGYHSDPERPGKPELAREMVDLLASRLPDRELHLVGDSAYATKIWRGLERVTVTFRVRASTTLYGPTPPPSGRRGYPRRWGARLGTPGQITQHPSTRWSKHTIHCYGHTQTATIAAIDCLWRPLGSQTPLRLIIARERTRHDSPQIALLTSDLATNPAQIIKRYADRWPIEACFEQAKQLFGVGHPRNRTPKAVQRTVPFQYLAMSLTTTWYALHGHHPDIVNEHRQRAPWYLTKTTPSFADMLAKLRRVILAAQYHPQQAHTPTNQEITQVQQAWAAAGL